MTRTLGLRVGGIVVQLDEDGKGGNSVSDMHYDSFTGDEQDPFESEEQWNRYKGAIDGLESLVLAHACSGVDVLSKEYREGVQTALEAISNNI